METITVRHSEYLDGPCDVATLPNGEEIPVDDNFELACAARGYYLGDVAARCDCGACAWYVGSSLAEGVQ